MAESGYSIEGLTDEQILDYAKTAFDAARDARRELDERKLHHYRLYRKFATDLTAHPHSPHARGQFGWSKITVPIVFWIIETILPRLVLNVPTVVVKAASPTAVPYAQQKQMRIQRQMQRAGMDLAMVQAIKSMLIYGDGFAKTTWNRYEHRPNFSHIPWRDFYVSEEARTFEDAEWLFHRTYYTPRDLINMARVTDSEGRPLWRGLVDAMSASGGFGSDEMEGEFRSAAGMGELPFSASTERVEMMECWHRDGSYVVLGGSDQSVLCRKARGPYLAPLTYDDVNPVGGREPGWERPEQRPWRPFATFSNTPDLDDTPYSISDAEMQEDYQYEVTTIRRQATDQVAANIFAPVVYQEDIGGKVIDRAFSGPGGKIPVRGDVHAAVARLNPGGMTSDVERHNDMSRGESQMVAGVSDYTVGAASGPGLNETATGVVKTIEEANMRWRFKQKLVESGMARVASMIDWLDRQYGTRLHVAADPNRLPAPGQEGVAAEDGMVALGMDANKDGAEYDVSVEAGSLTPASKREESQNLLAFIGALGAAPQLAAQANWQEIMHEVVAAHGFDPQRMIAPQAPAPTPGAGGAPAPPGLVPVGQPQLVEGG